MTTNSLPQQFFDSIAKFVKNNVNSDGTITLWLSVDLRSMLHSLGARATDAKAISNTLVQGLLYELGPKSTILVSAFNFDFPSTRVFNPLTSIVRTGSFGEQLRLQHQYQRTFHPIYSFLVFGFLSREFLRCQFEHSTGPDSVFDYLLRHNTHLITLGHHYVKSMTIIHHAEHIAGINYRHLKRFDGILVNQAQESSVQCFHFARNLESCCYSSLTLEGDRILRLKSVVKTEVISTAKKPISVYSVNLRSANEIMVKSLSVNTTKLVDYSGPIRSCSNLITHEIADKLYLEELR